MQGRVRVELRTVHVQDQVRAVASLGVRHTALVKVCQDTAEGRRGFAMRPW